MATQRDIAKLTGVSVSTVSRVLAGDWEKYASATVRDAVWQAAKELAYAPDISARSLRMGAARIKQPQIVTLIARPTAGEEDRFFGELVRSVDEELLRRGLATSWAGTVKGVTAKGRREAADGIALLGRCSRESVAQLRAVYGNVPMIGVGLNPNVRGEMDQVFCNGCAAAETAVKHLLAQGHTRIAYIGECSVESRYTGYYDTLTASGMHCDRGLVMETAQTEAGGAFAVSALLKRGTDATAIFCANDNVAIGAVKELKKAGIDIPAQMGIISIDDIRQAQFISPGLTTIHIPKDEMGRLAVTLLLDRLNGGHSEPLRLELPSRLVRRESC